MRVKDLIKELEKYDAELPICINDYMGFVEASEDTIKVEYKNTLHFHLQILINFIMLI